MGKQIWKPGTLLYPLPVVLVTCADSQGKENVMTAAWTGIVCSDPAMIYVSIRPERHSYHMIKESGEYVINLVTEELTFATDFCGVRSGRDMDKFKVMNLSRLPASQVKAPIIKESPLSLECKVTEIKALGSHDMFLAEIIAVQIDDDYMDENGKFSLNDSKLAAYSHGEYYGLGDYIGKFGYSVKKK